ncbi:uncharacterized protein [Henckelia pumila]|uniref:uncharacterized protein n=1 Tax=Henckelia pumila TaxID=405737 RepID=UPI003C6E9372
MEVISAPKLILGDYYFSAPTSPSHLSQFYYKHDHNFDDDFLSPNINLIGDDDFAFDVSEEWETGSQLSAEELFDGGVIKPAFMSSTSKPPMKKKIFLQGASFSPRGTKKNNPAAADQKTSTHERSGRISERAKSSSSSRRAARSLSPIRDYSWELEEEIINKQQIIISKNNNSSSMINCSSKGSKKSWRLKDLFLFRSASEGRAAEKDHLNKYSHSSFRKGPVSAHELHYTVNRAVSQDLKKKTFLPYKQGILGRLAFNPAVHALANGFGFSRK